MGSLISSKNRTQLHLLSSYILHYYYCYKNYFISCIYYVYRPKRSKSRASFQNLYNPRPHPHPPPTITTESKTVSSYPTPIQPPRRYLSQPSIHVDSSPILPHHLSYRNQILPQEAPSNRLKTLRSLLFRGHKTLGIEPMSIHRPPTRDFDSTLSEYRIQTTSPSVTASKVPKSPYEEQEDCVELKSECSILTNHNHGLLNRTKSSQQARQINCWDDI